MLQSIKHCFKTQGNPLNINKGFSMEHKSRYRVFHGIWFKIQGDPWNMSQDTECSLEHKPRYRVFHEPLVKIQGVPMNMSQNTGFFIEHCSRYSVFHGI